MRETADIYIKVWKILTLYWAGLCYLFLYAFCIIKPKDCHYVLQWTHIKNQMKPQKTRGFCYIALFEHFSFLFVFHLCMKLKKTLFVQLIFCQLWIAKMNLVLYFIQFLITVENVHDWVKLLIDRQYSNDSVLDRLIVQKELQVVNSGYWIV